MKKQLLTLALVLFATVLSAQQYQQIKVGLGFGYAAPADGGGGAAFYLEPAYRIQDEISVGLRLETALLGKSIGQEESSVSANGSYTVVGQYYLSNNKFRPYVGLGTGLYNLASISTNSTTAEISSGTKFGFYPRIGFDLGHFNMIFDYNLIPKTETSVDLTTGGTGNIEVKNSYWSLKLGFSIGGGEN